MLLARIDAQLDLRDTTAALEDLLARRADRFERAEALLAAIGQKISDYGSQAFFSSTAAARKSSRAAALRSSATRGPGKAGAPSWPRCTRVTATRSPKAAQ